MLCGLNSIDVSYATILHGHTYCTNDAHKLCLENYYCDIINAVLAPVSILPKNNPKSQRSFWTDELTELKRESVESEMEGTPPGSEANAEEAPHFQEA